MAKIDLSLLKNEVLEFVDPFDKEIVYTIPSNAFTNKFYIELQNCGIEMEKETDVEKSLKSMQELVYKIFVLDETKDFVTLEYIKERFNYPQLLNTIILETSNFLGGLMKNPNYKSPKSTQKKKK